MLHTLLETESVVYKKLFHPAMIMEVLVWPSTIVEILLVLYNTPRANKLLVIDNNDKMGRSITVGIQGEIKS